MLKTFDVPGPEQFIMNIVEYKVKMEALADKISKTFQCDVVCLSGTCMKEKSGPWRQQNKSMKQKGGVSLNSLTCYKLTITISDHECHYFVIFFYFPERIFSIVFTRPDIYTKHIPKVKGIKFVRINYVIILLLSENLV